MTFTKRLLSILAFATICLSACNDDPVYDYDNDYNWRKDNWKIEAAPFTIAGKLYSKKYVSSGMYKPIPWKQGAGKLIAWDLKFENISETTVNEDGSFILTLPGTLKYPSITQCECSNGEKSFYSFFSEFSLHEFIFSSQDNPNTPDVDESLTTQKYISANLIDNQDSCYYRDIEFRMSEDVALSYLSKTTNSKYNVSYKKGWNITVQEHFPGISFYSVLDSIPSNVVWF